MLKGQNSMEENLKVVENLIKAMIEYALENSWSDSDVIDTLVGCGITEQDFIRCGYGDFVKEYFKNEQQKKGHDFVKKFKKYLETWLDGKKVRGIEITPYEIEECLRVYNAISKKEKCEFICAKVKEILVLCNIPFKTKGIGWVIVY